MGHSLSTLHDPQDTVDLVRIAPLDTRRPGEPKYAISLPRDMACLVKARSEDLRWLRVDGDGNDPNYRDGDIVVIELRTSPIDGAMHVVSANERPVLRRLSGRTAGGWRIGCDRNALDFETAMAVAVVGVVICRMCRS